MLGAVDLGVLEAYRNTIQKLHRTYGEVIWLNLYQADVRARLERIPRHRLALVGRHRAAQAVGGTTAFDPSRPWNGAFTMMIQDRSWWTDNFTEPALLIRAGVSKAGSYVDGDAPIGAIANVMNTPAPLQRVVQDRRPRQPARTPPPPPVHSEPRNKRPRGGQHLVANGYYTHNRQGKPICDEHQNNTCTRGPSCPKSHVCNRCLDNRHGSRYPTTCMAAEPAQSSAPPPPVHSKGRGKGKGKKGGKKGY